MARLPSVGFTTLPWLPGVQDWLGAEGRARGEVLESCSTTRGLDEGPNPLQLTCKMQTVLVGGVGWGGGGGTTTH